MEICRHHQKSTVTAFSLVELAVVVLIVGLVFGMVMPAMMQTNYRSSKIACVPRLKEIGMGFRIFSADNADRFPFVVPVSMGGTMEWRSNAVVWPHFKVLSNGLSSPQVLVCPADEERKPAKDFPSLTEQNISYFLNLSAAGIFPQSILAGDRMLMTNAVALKNQFLEVVPTLNLQISPDSHSSAINVVLGDGSVQQLSLARLHQQLTNSIQGTNGPERWVFP